MILLRASTAVVLLAALIGCGTTPKTPDAPDNDDPVADETTPDAADIPVTPRREAPPGLTAAEKGELGSRCNIIDPELYDAGKKAMQKLTELLASDPKAEGLETTALEAGLASLGAPMQGMSQGDHDACVALFRKDVMRKLFEFEPADVAARNTITACVKRVMAEFGKGNMSFGDGAGGATGPFCPGDLPVPMTLAELPYTSSADDWDSRTWKCLKFGLRTKQDFQLEYKFRGAEFACIARYLPRQGGAPIELIHDGKVDDEGELQVSKGTRRQRMK